MLARAIKRKEKGTEGGQSLTCTSERSNVLKRSSLGGGSGDDDAVLHGVVLLERLDELGDSRTLLANSDVNTVKLLGLVVAVIPPLLVEHSVKGDGSLSGLTVTNDELTLATADRHLSSCQYQSDGNNQG